MTTPRWLRVHRQKQTEQKRWPARYITNIQTDNLEAFKNEMAAWSKRQIWTTGDNR